MAWTARQIQKAAIACKRAGISDEQRKLLLRQLPNSLFDRHGRPTGEPSSTSDRLDQGDYEWFMAQVEAFAGGQIPGNTANYWHDKAADELQRVRHLAQRIANTLEVEGLLQPDGVGLAGWIEKRVTNRRTDRLDDLTAPELQVLISGLRAYARRHGVEGRDEYRQLRLAQA